MIGTLYRQSPQDRVHKLARVMANIPQSMRDFVKQEAAGIGGIAMERGVHKGRFMTHRVQQCVQHAEEALALPGVDDKADQIGHAHLTVLLRHSRRQRQRG